KNTELISGESQTTSSANPPVDSSFSNVTINNTQLQNKVDVVTENNKSNSTKIENKKESFFFQGSAKVNFEEDGKNIEMMINNENIQLKIDGNIIDPENYNQYNSIIEKGKLLKKESDNLNDKTTSQSNIEKERNKQTMNEIISQLEKDQIIDPSSHFEFRLTGTKMLINEVEQSEILFNKYKLLYESASGNRLNMKSNIKIKH
ncbi:MAG: hypothetical protein ACKVQV_14210, partial [Bacteroidia bacterium]